jgi:hypothetical protein
MYSFPPASKSVVNTKCTDGNMSCADSADRQNQVRSGKGFVALVSQIKQAFLLREVHKHGPCGWSDGQVAGYNLSRAGLLHQPTACCCLPTLPDRRKLDDPPSSAGRQGIIHDVVRYFRRYRSRCWPHEELDQKPDQATQSCFIEHSSRMA